MGAWWKPVFGVIVIFLAAGLIVLVGSPPRGQPVTLLQPPTPAPVFVHVAGAVQQPGVYSLPHGSRVQDAIQAAGGMLPEADAHTLNLAAFLQDGSRVLVPTLPPPSPTPNPDFPNVKTPTPVVRYPINLNTATLFELESLPEIGPVTAQKIIEFRQEHGAFQSIEDIMKVPGIGQKTFEAIKDKITV